MNYADYLKSDHWTQLKARVKKPAECSGCARVIPLQLHHLYYRSRWEDACPNDLLWICADCHKLYHMAFGTNLTRETYIKKGRSFIRRFTIGFLRAAATEFGYGHRLGMGGKGCGGNEVRKLLEKMKKTEGWSKLRDVKEFIPPSRQSNSTRLGFQIHSLPETLEQLESAKSPRGGWKRKTLAQWGVPWPPPKGWKARLEASIK